MQKIKNALSSHDSQTSGSSVGNDSSVAQSSPATSRQQPSQATSGAPTSGQATSGQATSGASGFTGPHDVGHDRQRDTTNNFDLNQAEHKHTHLGEKQHHHHHGHQVEEVERQKVHERHVHHTQHHVQPVHDEVHHETKHTQNLVPETKITETHGSSKADIAGFHTLASKHKDEVHDHGVERTVVDKGEKVDERVHHHVHNVVQPIVKTDHHHHETVHTVIPTHHVTHEAPVIHESIEHAPVSKADFLKSGGNLGSGVSAHEAANLNEAGCDRKVDGVAEKLSAKLGLSGGSSSAQPTSDARV